MFLPLLGVAGWEEGGELCVVLPLPGVGVGGGEGMSISVSWSKGQWWTNIVCWCSMSAQSPGQKDSDELFVDAACVCSVKSNDKNGTWGFLPVIGRKGELCVDCVATVGSKGQWWIVCWCSMSAHSPGQKDSDVLFADNCVHLYWLAGQCCVSRDKGPLWWVNCVLCFCHCWVFQRVEKRVMCVDCVATVGCFRVEKRVNCVCVATVGCFRVEKRVMKCWVFEGGEEGDEVLGVWGCHCRVFQGGEEGELIVLPLSGVSGWRRGWTVCWLCCHCRVFQRRGWWSVGWRRGWTVCWLCCHCRVFQGGEEGDEVLGVSGWRRGWWSVGCFRVEKRVMKCWVFQGGEEGDEVLGVSGWRRGWWSVGCFRVEKRVMKCWVFQGGEEGDEVLGVSGWRRGWWSVGCFRVEKRVMKCWVFQGGEESDELLGVWGWRREWWTVGCFRSE